MNEQGLTTRRAFMLDSSKLTLVLVAIASGTGAIVIEHVIRKMSEPSFPKSLTLNKGEAIEIDGTGMVIFLKDASADRIFNTFADIRILSSEDKHQLSGDILKMNEGNKTENKRTMFYNGYSITVEEIIRSMTSTTVKVVVDKA